MPNIKAKDIIRRLNLSSLWLFVTNRCNLNCGYCFFKDRCKTSKLSLGDVKSILEAYPREKHLNIVISGGEPCYEWGMVESIFKYARVNFINCRLMLETNGIMLDSQRIKFIKKHGVAVELGIDGDFKTTAEHRRGISISKFNRLLGNIDLILKLGIKVSPTMTVHPRQAKKMLGNFQYLASLGLYSIDVHPALFESWTKAYSDDFVSGYKQIVEYDNKNNGSLLNKSYSLPMKLSFDLVVLPEGLILPNWVYLCLCATDRIHYAIGRISNGRILFDREKLLYFLAKYKEFFRKNRSYGELSNYNLEIMYKDIRDKAVKKTLNNYFQIWRAMKEADYQI